MPPSDFDEKLFLKTVSTMSNPPKGLENVNVKKNKPQAINNRLKTGSLLDSMAHRLAMLLLLLLTGVIIIGGIQSKTAIAAGTTYYVSLSGDDSNPGTEVSPFRTIQRGVSAAQAGDTVIAEAGNYGSENVTIENSGTENARIVIKAARAGDVILEGSDGSCVDDDSCSGDGFLLEGKNFVTIEGFEIRYYGTGIEVSGGGNHIFRRNILKNNSGQGIQVWKSNNNLVEECQFIDLNPPGQVLRDAIQDYGVNFYYSENSTVINSYFYGNHNQALSYKKGDHGGLVSGNTFEGCLYTCVYLGQNDQDPLCSDIIVERNVFRPAAYPYRLKSPVHARNVVNAIIRNNFMEGMNESSGQGISVWSMAGNVLIYNNVIVNSPQPGIRHNGPADFYNNTIVNTGGITSGEDGTNNYINDDYDYGHNPAGFAGPFDDPTWPSSPNPQFTPDFTRARAFRLTSDSLLIDSGVPITEVSDDLDDVERPQGLAYDIGAFEYQVNGPVPTPTPASTFSDVPFSHWAHDYVEVLYQQGFVAGCSTEPLMYCPDDTMSRAESAVFVERGVHGAEYMPVQPTDQIFADVPLGEWFAKWSTALWEESYTAGCGTNPLIYCPLQGHTRTEGCVFFLRMLYGTDYVPPDPQGIFNDVPLDWWGTKWIETAYNAGLIPACETTPELRFCPDGPLDRAMGAYMMVQAKGLEIP
jgi:parallel beta-helix repeat protein